MHLQFCLFSFILPPILCSFLSPPLRKPHYELLIIHPFNPCRKYEWWLYWGPPLVWNEDHLSCQNSQKMKIDLAKKTNFNPMVIHLGVDVENADWIQWRWFIWNREMALWSGGDICYACGSNTICLLDCRLSYCDKEYVQSIIRDLLPTGIIRPSN